MKFSVMNNDEVILTGKEQCRKFLEETGMVTGDCESCGLPTVHLGHWISGEVSKNWFCANLDCDKGFFDSQIIEHLAFVKNQKQAISLIHF